MAAGKNNSKFMTQSQYNKADEFYTTLEDIELELQHHIYAFKDKTVYLNCDDPNKSNFWRYFHINFSKLGLKKLVATYYNPNCQPQSRLVRFVNYNPQYQYQYCGGDDNNIEVSEKTNLEGNGDFRSAECVRLLNESDIVVTNPPFSLFREYVAQLMEFNKKFLIIGNVNALTYKEIFPLFKNNSVWYGASIHSGDRKFVVPNSYPLNAVGCGIDENGQRYIKVKGIRWFTNFDYPARHEKLTLWRSYIPEEYPKYDNYDAINVNKCSEIPMDYNGIIGVPITFMDFYCPEQFEIVGGSMYDDTPCRIDKNYTVSGYKFLKPDGVSISGSGALRDRITPKIPIKGSSDYSVAPDGTYLSSTYQRIFIRKWI